MSVTPQDILSFWFHEMTPDKWFFGGDDVDALIKERFQKTTEDALKGKYDNWAETPRGRLALILVLDQFTRNIFRATPKSYEGDQKAQDLVVKGLEAEMDKPLHFAERHFFYMPLMHAEDKDLQTLSIEKFTELHAFAEYVITFAKGHAETVHTFGRFPHRNAFLGRTTTPEEEIHLKSDKNPFK